MRDMRVGRLSTMRGAETPLSPLTSTSNGSTGQKPRPVVEHRRLVVEDDAEIVEHVSEFRLRAIVRHQGPSFDSGHYVAFILRNGNLTEYNDSVVTEFGAADEHALADCIDSANATARLLVYERTLP